MGVHLLFGNLRADVRLYNSTVWSVMPCTMAGGLYGYHSAHEKCNLQMLPVVHDLQ